MGVFEMVAIIVVIGCVTGVITTYIESKNKAAANAPPAEFAAMQAQLKASDAEVEKLKDRVRVLEKLVTDEDHRLAREIDQLGSRDSAGA